MHVRAGRQGESRARGGCGECGVPWEANSETRATETVVVRAVKRTVRESGVEAVDRVRWWKRRSLAQKKGRDLDEHTLARACGAKHVAWT